MKKIIWLASYPKSGNTWTRAFLSNLLLNENDRFDINKMIGGPIASQRSLIDDYLLLESTDFTVNEIEQFRPDSVKHFASSVQNDYHFMKVHDAYTQLPNGKPLIPTEATKGAIYLVRNPLDVAVSFAHHNGISVEKMVPKINDTNYSFCDSEKGVRRQVMQKLLTWGEHYESWISQQEFPVLLIRYEDMKNDTLNTFKKIVDFAGIQKTKTEIQQAIDQCAFDKLQQKEQETGFKEKNQKGDAFFRKGKTGSWREELSLDLAQQIIEANLKTMQNLGYLNENNQPIY